MNVRGKCPHNYDLRTCNVCKAEAVRDAIRPGNPLTRAVDRAIHEAIDRGVVTARGARAVAIVALRRIVDRSVRDELHSPATADILRIALKALNQLED